MVAMAMKHSDRLHIEVTAFASAAERIGSRTIRLELPKGSTVDHVWNLLMDRHAGLETLTSGMAFGLNDQLVRRDVVLNDGDRLDLLPPVSGG